MTDKDYKVIPASEVTFKPRKSPMHLIRESVDGDFWMMQEVADHIGVNIETIRRVVKKRNPDGSKYVKAPTSAVRSGQAVIYLFTKDDVIEIENHFDDHGYRLKKRINPKKSLESQR